MIDSKWTGTDTDRREMKTLQLEQVVRVCQPNPSPSPPKILTAQRNFGPLAMFGFASTLLATWEVIATYAPP
jgi:hypothetical protein